MYLLFINDIVNCRRIRKCVLYADDTSLYTDGVGDLEHLITRANDMLRDYGGWFNSNRLTLNVRKSNDVIFHRKQKKIPPFSSKLVLNGVDVSRVYETKFLGVVLDPHLSWECHINNLSRKLAKFSPVIFRIRKLCSFNSLKLIYNCLIYSNLIYCNSVWGFCKVKARSPLTRIHKKIVRALAGVSYYHPTESLYKDLFILNPDKINAYMVGIFVYKCLRNDVAMPFFTYRQQTYSTRLAEDSPLFVPQIGNIHSEQRISYRGPFVWNSIPVEIRNLPFNSFKKAYKSILINS